jgi:hypothetical protein
MRHILSYFTTVLIFLTIFTPAHSASPRGQRPSLSADALQTQGSDNSLRTEASLAARARRASMAVRFINRLPQHSSSPRTRSLPQVSAVGDPQTLESFSLGAPEHSLPDQFDTSRRESNSSESDPNTSTHSHSERLKKARRSIDSARLNTPSRRQSTASLAPEEPVDNHFNFKVTHQHLEIAGVSAAAITFLALKFKENSTPQKRFFTGLEATAASYTLSGLYSCASTGVGLALLGYTGYKINRFIHRKCKSDLQQTKEEFHAALDEHVDDDNRRLGELADGLTDVSEVVAELADAVAAGLGTTQATQTAQRAHIVAGDVRQVKEEIRQQPLQVKVRNKNCLCC